MSWVCDVCSSNNDDDVLECFVCGTHRSEASIREGKRRAMEEKLQIVSDFIYAKVYLGLKVTGIVALLTVLVSLILIITKGNLFVTIKSNFPFLLSAISRRFIANDSVFFVYNPFSALPFKAEIFRLVLFEYDNYHGAVLFLKTMAGQLLNSINEMFAILGAELPSRQNFLAFVAMRELLTKNIKELSVVIAHLVYQNKKSLLCFGEKLDGVGISASNRIAWMSQILKEIWESVKKSFEFSLLFVRHIFSTQK